MSTIRNKPIDLTAPAPLSDDLLKLIPKERMDELMHQCEIEVEAELRIKAEETFLRHARIKARQEKVPEEQLHEIFIDLPPEQSTCLLINGKMYLAGQTYHVTKAEYDNMRSMMWRAWWCESQRWDDTRENMYRRKLETQINAKGQSVNAGWYASQGFGAAVGR